MIHFIMRNICNFCGSSDLVAVSGISPGGKNNPKLNIKLKTSHRGIERNNLELNREIRGAVSRLSTVFQLIHCRNFHRTMQPDLP